MSTILIMAGGTGGHIFPGLALANALRARGDTVHWMGGQYGLEKRLVPDAGLPLHALSVRGLRGQRGLARVLAPFKLVWAVFEALSYLRKIRPALCVGFGGYPAAPGGVAAKLLGIPVIVHEQNAVAGMTNRLLARLSQRVATAFPGVLPDAQHVGNPVRDGIESLGLARVAGGHQSGASIRVLVIGGSQGARAFNHTLPSLLSPLIQRHGLVVRHQSGDAMHAEVVAKYASLGVTVQVDAFISDMVEAYGQHDLVIARAGALTVSELAAAAMPSILVPFPAAVDDHQTCNARWLVDAGAAVLLPEKALDRLPEVLTQFVSQPEQLTIMARAARAISTPDAIGALVSLIDEVQHG